MFHIGERKQDIDGAVSNPTNLPSEGEHEIVLIPLAGLQHPWQNIRNVHRGDNRDDRKFLIVCVIAHEFTL